jgi:hypothetical protein
MIEILREAPGSLICGRSGLPLLAICPNGTGELSHFVC